MLSCRHCYEGDDALRSACTIPVFPPPKNNRKKKKKSNKHLPLPQQVKPLAAAAPSYLGTLVYGQPSPLLPAAPTGVQELYTTVRGFELRPGGPIPGVTVW